MVIGITGGIGTGKSTLTIELFQKIKEKNISIIILDTDKIAKDLQMPNSDCYNKIINSFGINIINEEKIIDYKKLSEIVLNDKSKLKILNNIVHPQVVSYLKQQIKTNKNKIILIESALLIETEINLFCNYVICVTTNIDIRKKRLKEYRNYSEEKINEFIKNQNDEKYYLKHSDFICKNNEKNDIKEFVDDFINNQL